MLLVPGRGGVTRDGKGGDGTDRDGDGTSGDGDGTGGDGVTELAEAV